MRYVWIEYGKYCRKTRMLKTLRLGLSCLLLAVTHLFGLSTAASIMWVRAFAGYGVEKNDKGLGGERKIGIEWRVGGTGKA